MTKKRGVGRPKGIHTKLGAWFICTLCGEKTRSTAPAGRAYHKKDGGRLKKCAGGNEGKTWKWDKSKKGPRKAK